MLKDKTAIITGGSSGIGAATAILFAKQGANVVITYKENEKGANEVAEKIKNLGKEALIVQADLINEMDAKKVVDETMKKFKQIDILVNNAGRYINGDEWNGPSELWIESLQQNLVSAMSMSKYTIEIFQQQKSGIIVNVSSCHSGSGKYDSISYGAAKAGMVNMTQSHAKLLRSFGRANCVSPGAVNAGYWLTAPKEEIEANLATKFFGKFSEPEDIAEIILFLAAHKSSMNTRQNIFTGSL
jgi:3-oxoacyl-[acyl-carrier protein] reductase